MDNRASSSHFTTIETFEEEIGAERNNGDNENWEKEESQTSNTSIREELRNFFVKFVTQLVWGCIINLRVCFLILEKKLSVFRMKIAEHGYLSTRLR